MPIYEYRCSSCGFERDALQKMADPPLVDCPQCGKPALVKLVSAAGFHLKGSGWYATDFKNSGKSKPAAKDDAAKPDAAAADSTATSGDSKPGETKSGAQSADNASPTTAKPEASKPESKPASSSTPSSTTGTSG